MKVRISPSVASGTVSAPPSKSMAHRLLIAAALSKGESVLDGVSLCEDVLATVDCLRSLGVSCERTGDRVTIKGGLSARSEAVTLPCRESGSTIRFFLPIALLSDAPTRLVGAPSLLRRPMTVYRDLCAAHGLDYSQTEEGIFVKGPLLAGEYSLPGNVSSQFVSGMLFALTQVGGVSILRLIPPVESRSYIFLTVAALKRFGASVEWTDEYTLRIDGSASMTAQSGRVEGDYSNAAFLEAFNLFGGDVRVTGLDPASLQGDRVYTDCFAQLAQGEANISLEDCPDLAPILFAVAAAKHGACFTDTKRLKIKESDRAETMACELRKFGASVKVYDNSVVIEKVPLHTPCEALCGHNDHRIVMSLAVLASVLGGEIEGAEAVRKSFPDFFEKLSALGIGVTEV